MAVKHMLHSGKTRGRLAGSEHEGGERYASSRCESGSYGVKSTGRKITWRSKRARERDREREGGGGGEEGEGERARISGKINELESRRSDGWMVQAGNRKI